MVLVWWNADDLPNFPTIQYNELITNIKNCLVIVNNPIEYADALLLKTIELCKHKDYKPSYATNCTTFSKPVWAPRQRNNSIHKH